MDALVRAGPPGPAFSLMDKVICARPGRRGRRPRSRAPRNHSGCGIGYLPRAGPGPIGAGPLVELVSIQGRGSSLGSMRRISGLLLCLLAPAILSAYAVLSHEAIVDATWLDSIRPLLLKRFPQATPEQLKAAHAYAYGGCILQDMGYYPFGSKFFSDLVHYVRSGAFVEELIRESQDLNGDAFALGSLAHYAADNTGHPLAVNPSVALAYPKLRARYGPLVTYEENPAAHLKVEFGFDVVEVASGNYAPEAYHDFIGFQVSKRLLESAFKNTYGLGLRDVFRSVDLALGTYRRTVSTLLPEATKVAWQIQKDDIRKAHPGITRARFIYNLSRSSYQREWDREYRRPGPLARILAFLFRLIPKVGPFRSLQFKAPTQEMTRFFMASFNATLTEYRRCLREVAEGRLSLPNRDFDTGKLTAPAEYALADDTYSKLVRTLADKHFSAATPEIEQDILTYFQNPHKFSMNRDAGASYY